MKGYKAFTSDLTCRGFQYEIGKTYSIDEDPILCEKGFHFCDTIGTCYHYYPANDSTRICEIEALGNIVPNEAKSKYCTNKIKIIKEITDPFIKKANFNKTNTGYCNMGFYNSGLHNIGDYNEGHGNVGDGNTGAYNTGDFNSGDYNTGDYNLGNNNTGNFNYGGHNVGNHNIGSYNVGEYNFGHFNNGIFNTETPNTIYMFDKPSDWTIDRWDVSKQAEIIHSLPTQIKWIHKDEMTDAEKEKHPEYKCSDGYAKVLKFNEWQEQVQIWFDNLSEDDLNCLKQLPNFDMDKFKTCIGIGTGIGKVVAFPYV